MLFPCKSLRRWETEGDSCPARVWFFEVNHWFFSPPLAFGQPRGPEEHHTDLAWGWGGGVAGCQLVLCSLLAFCSLITLTPAHRPIEKNQIASSWQDLRNLPESLDLPLFFSAATGPDVQARFLPQPTTISVGSEWRTTPRSQVSFPCGTAGAVSQKASHSGLQPWGGMGGAGKNSHWNSRAGTSRFSKTEKNPNSFNLSGSTRTLRCFHSSVL